MHKVGSQRRWQHHRKGASVADFDLSSPAMPARVVHAECLADIRQISQTRVKALRKQSGEVDLLQRQAERDIQHAAVPRPAEYSYTWKTHPRNATAVWAQLRWTQ
jgi:hypothetical protein